MSCGLLTLVLGAIIMGISFVLVGLLGVWILELIFSLRREAPIKQARFFKPGVKINNERQ